MRAKVFTGIVILMLSLPVFVWAAGHGDDRPFKKGILLVTFGTSIPEAQISFKNIDTKVKETFKGVDVRWAYTSAIIRHKLAKENRENLDSVAMALAKMMDEGFTYVVIQSLHTIRGEEYDDLVNTANAFKHIPNGFKGVVVGNPLLSSQEDIERVAKAIISAIPEKRKKKEAVVLMGHGTPHPANAFYAALMFNLQQMDPNIFIGTVEGSPGIDDIKKMLKGKKIKKVYLMPFMSVAGDHARNDMAGNEADSWKSILTESGIKCNVVLKGTAENDKMVAIWIDHLKAADSHFNKCPHKK